MEILGESFKHSEEEGQGDENKSYKVSDTRKSLEKKKVSNHKIAKENRTKQIFFKTTTRIKLRLYHHEQCELF